jgi:DNA-binding NarL/FixJ family response regulator
MGRANSGDAPRLQFVHPLVRAAVYDRLGQVEQVAGHAAAAQLLLAARAEPEQVAAHVLRIPAPTRRELAAALREAAKDALTRGSPDAAMAYLERCIEEPLAEPERLEVLVELCTAAELVDQVAAIRYLSEALTLAGDPYQRARIADRLCKTMTQLLRVGDVIAVATDAARSLPEHEIDLRRRLESDVLHVTFHQPGRTDILERLPALRGLALDNSVGGRELDCAISINDAFAGDRAGVSRALRGLGDGMLLTHAPGEPPMIVAWLALIAADLDEAMDSMNAAIAQGHKRGSARSLAPAYAFRGWAWLSRGQLAEAEADTLASAALVEQHAIEAGRFFAAGFLAETLLEQGRLDQAQDVLVETRASNSPPMVGAVYFFLQARARLLRLRGHHEAALKAALASGARFAEHGGLNPAIIDWRSEAALSLHALARNAEAMDLAEEELRLARAWGAPRALGRALRVVGLLHEGPECISLLREAVDILEKSPARLEYAKALVELGAALRRSGRRSEAKGYLAGGLDLSHHCGAPLLTRHAESELRAAGARPRRPYLTGPAALTPSEHRVAELAAEGLTNRDIAQKLFVTVKTVEVHLSSTYRKLGITRREHLHAKDL